MSCRFWKIHSSWKRLGRVVVVGGGCLGPSAALPRWAQAWHQWPERAGILDMSITLPPHYALALPPVRAPSRLFSLLPVWMQRLAGWVRATATVCMWNKAPQNGERGSRELHMVPAKSRDGCLSFPLAGPFFGWEVLVWPQYPLPLQCPSFSLL